VARGNGLTRGDRNRNRKIAVLRQVVARDRAVLAVDLGEDKQAAVLVDHEGRVLARKTARAKAHQLGGLLEWAAGQAARAGFGGLVVACEPTGHRWKALMGLADAAGHGFCCVQPVAVARSREGDDYTRDKTDHRDAYLIGRLAVRLECYLPERADQAWARLRHLGARRSALGAAARPLRSVTWLAALGVVTDRCCGDPARLRKMGYARFLAAVRRELPRWDGKYVRHSSCRGYGRRWPIRAGSPRSAAARGSGCTC
jgi:transposase